MMSQKKVFQFKKMLDGNEAVPFLAELTRSKLDGRDFMDIVKAQGARAYIDADIMDPDLSSTEVGTGREVVPVGLHEVKQGLEDSAFGTTQDPESGDIRHITRLRSNKRSLVFRGQNDEGKTVEWKIIDSFVKGLRYEEPLLFKPADIQALADRLNGKTPAEIQQEQLSQLRKQVTELETENEALKAHGVVADGLTFPYSTPEIKAMYEAAKKHWAEYSEKLRMPTQKEIRMDIAEALGMDPTKEQRKTVELAAAIKPKEYRET